MAQAEENPEASNARITTGGNSYADLPVDLGTFQSRTHEASTFQIAGLLNIPEPGSIGNRLLNSQISIGEEVSNLAKNATVPGIMDPETAALRDSFFQGIATGNTSAISRALRDYGENKNSPRAKSIEQALRGFEQGMKQIGYETKLDLNNQTFSLTRPNLISGEKQSLEISKTREPNALQFFADTFKQDTQVSPVEAALRANRIEQAMSPPLNSVAPLKAALGELADLQSKISAGDGSPLSQQRQSELQGLLQKLAGDMTRFDPRQPAYTSSPLIEAKFDQRDGSFSIRLNDSKNMTFRMDNDGSTRIEGATDLQQFLTTMHQIRSKQDVRAI